MNTLNRKYKAGVIGLGHQSLEDHIPAIKASPDVELVGVVEVDEQKLKSFLEENKDIDGYNNIDDFLKNKQPDFIVITVPHHLHYEIVKKATERRIHILKEKPFAISFEQGKEIKKLAEKTETQIMITLQRRFNPIYSTFFQLIDKIGEPFFIESKYTFYTDSPHEGWRGRKDLAGGGCLIDMGYHAIDLLMWYFGLPDLVFAETSCAAKENTCYDAEDTAQITFRYNSEKNIFGSLLVSRVIPPKQEFINIYGTRGIIHIERGKIERYASNGETQEALKREQQWSSAAQDQIEYFLKVIEGKKENLSNPEFHLQHLAFIEAAYKARESKQYINPKKYLEK
ncbi:Gfo/Idh/MocA family oxidoreductase [Candidatus Azambacteria bacterium]|nr:Gfo/Idh/MocA family oxidoreductase [Candidatus Azambacteria bacterium]